MPGGLHEVGCCATCHCRLVDGECPWCKEYDEVMEL